MRPVNLLPERERAQAPTAAGGSAYVVVGVLAALLLAVFAFVMTSNSVNSRTSDIAKAAAEADQAEARAGAFGPFQQFAQIKTARVESIKTLADTRFDWERLMRELALVLPSGTSLTSVTASSGEAAAGTTPTPPAPTGATTPDASSLEAGSGSATLALTGCATSQRTVAVTLVRLRQLHRATDVTLVDSSQQESAGATPPGAAPADGNTGCSGSDYLFNVTVTFAADVVNGEDEDLSVPSTLGGGA